MLKVEQYHLFSNVQRESGRNRVPSWFGNQVSILDIILALSLTPLNLTHQLLRMNKLYVQAVRFLDGTVTSCSCAVMGWFLFLRDYSRSLVHTIFILIHVHFCFSRLFCRFLTWKLMFWLGFLPDVSSISS